MRQPSATTESLPVKRKTAAKTPAAGIHLLVDFWGARYLDDMARIDAALRAAVIAAGATLLHIYLHAFEANGGVSGVAILAESHISIHTWPERGYAALDVFMCGACDPQRAVAALKTAFLPRKATLRRYRRGRPDGSSRGFRNAPPSASGRAR